MSIAVKRPIPGYIVLKQHELKRKIGAWNIAQEDPENAPEVGEVLAVGPRINKMPFDEKYLPTVGDLIVYKKYNVFRLNLSAEPTLLCHFENIVAVLEESRVENQSDAN